MLGSENVSTEHRAETPGEGAVVQGKDPNPSQWI